MKYFNKSATSSVVSGKKIHSPTLLPAIIPVRDNRTFRIKPPIQDVSYVDVTNEPIITPPPKKILQLNEGRMSSKSRNVVNDLGSGKKPIITPSGINTSGVNLAETTLSKVNLAGGATVNLGGSVLSGTPKWMRPSLIGTGAVAGGAIGALGGSLFNSKDSSTGTVVGGLTGATLGGGAAAWHSSGQNNKLMGKALQLFNKFKKV